MRPEDVRNLLATAGIDQTITAPAFALALNDNYEDALKALLDINQDDRAQIAQAHYLVVMCRPQTAHTWLHTIVHHILTSQEGYTVSLLQGSINGLLRAGVDLDTSLMETEFQRELLKNLFFIIFGTEGPLTPASKKDIKDFNKTFTPLLEGFLFLKELDTKPIPSERMQELKQAVGSISMPQTRICHETARCVAERLAYAIFNKQTTAIRFATAQSILSSL